MIETFIITIVSLLIGYGLGRNIFTKDNVENLGKTIKRPFQDNYVGPINRPTAQQVYERDNPGKKDAMDEVRKVFEQGAESI